MDNEWTKLGDVIDALRGVDQVHIDLEAEHAAAAAAAVSNRPASAVLSDLPVAD